ncbi:MAG: putative transport system permease protein [Microbacteriaceae bacterium]|jgi:putative ABC transport system permease protein|nr:putative transport system permease protein [Microbacteriaceae bacterium]
MNFRDVIGTAIASTFRSKLRTTLTVIAIFIGAFTLTITSAIGTGVSNYINTQVASIGNPNVMTVTKAADATASTDTGPAKYDPSTSAANTQGARQGIGRGSAGVLTAADLSAIKATAGVLSVTPSVQLSPDYIQYGSNGKYVLTLSANAGLTKADLAAGAQLNDNSTASQIMLPTTYLSNLGFTNAKRAIGQTVAIGITDYAGQQHVLDATVVGIQNATLFGTGAAANTGLTDALQQAEATGRPASITTNYASATVTFANAATPAQITQLKKALSDQGYTGQTVADRLGSFETVINGIVGVLDAFAVIALIAAGFGIVNTLLMSVQERTREIGLMKAMGMGGGRIYALFSLEAIFIGFLGSAIGAVVAIVLGSIASRILSRRLLADLPGLHLLQFAPGSIATIILVVMGIAFLAGTLPARRASRQNPIDALRYE